MGRTPGGVAYFREDEAGHSGSSAEGANNSGINFTALDDGGGAPLSSSQAVSGCPANAAASFLLPAYYQGLQGCPLPGSTDSVAGGGAHGGQGHRGMLYCEVCRRVMPLRTKHCRDCRRCVRTHDHHCPWLNNCVAENNRGLFFWFVSLLALESLWVFLIGVECIFSDPEEQGGFYRDNGMGIPMLLPLGLFVVFLFFMALSGLSATHVWLAAANITTWEYLKRRRISYLQDHHPAHGSPFSINLPCNLAAYCCTGYCACGWRPLKSCGLHMFQRASGVFSDARARAIGRGPSSRQARPTEKSDLLASQAGSKGGWRLGEQGEIVWVLGEPHVPWPMDVGGCYTICSQLAP